MAVEYDTISNEDRGMKRVIICNLAKTLIQHVLSGTYVHKRANQMQQQQHFVACVSQCTDWAIYAANISSGGEASLPGEVRPT